jgi:hypothetical protein
VIASAGLAKRRGFATPRPECPWDNGSRACCRSGSNLSGVLALVERGLRFIRKGYRMSHKLKCLAFASAPLGNQFMGLGYITQR